MGDDEFEQFEEAVVDQATAARTIEELQAETDRKWEELLAREATSQEAAAAS